MAAKEHLQLSLCSEFKIVASFYVLTDKYFPQVGPSAEIIINGELQIRVRKADKLELVHSAPCFVRCGVGSSITIM